MSGKEQNQYLDTSIAFKSLQIKQYVSRVPQQQECILLESTKRLIYIIEEDLRTCLYELKSKTNSHITGCEVGMIKLNIL